MERYSNNVQDTLGNAVSGVTVTVRLSSDSSLATIYSDNIQTAKANPFTNDSDGELFFFAANENYDIILTGPVTETRSRVTLFESADTPIRGPVLVGSTAGPTSLALGQVVLVDVTSNAVALTLPDPDTTLLQFPDIVVQHVQGAIAANNITIGRNTNNINGVAADMVMSAPGQALRFFWAGNAVGWAVQNVSSPLNVVDFVSSNVVLADATLATVLSVGMIPSSRYAVEALLLATVVAADDLDWAFNEPAAGWDGNGIVISTGDDSIAAWTEDTELTQPMSGALDIVSIKGEFSSDSTGGLLNLQVAKNLDTGADGTLHAGSWLKATYLGAV